MVYKFDSANKNKLDSDWRRENLPAYNTLETLGLIQMDTVADIGCGAGYFSVPAAEMVGDQYNVFALDTSSEMLDEVKKSVAVAHVTNIVLVKTEEYDFKLPDEMVTFALLVNVLHEVEDAPRFIAEIRRVLKPNGRLAVIDWEKKPMEMGPSIDQRIVREEVIRMIESGGCVLQKEMQFAEGVFYGLVFSKE